MAQYDALEAALQAVKGNHIDFGIDAIERLIGAPLPQAARSASWWSNEGASGQRRPWTKAGYNAELRPDRLGVSFVRQGYRIVWRSDDTVWLERENLSEAERAEGLRTAHDLIRLIARSAVHACDTLGVQFDMGDPEVARDVFAATIDGLFNLRPQAKTRPRTKD